MKIIYNDLTHAAKFMKCRNISVDIETNTTIPPDSKWKPASFGLSNSAPITYISLYAVELDPLVLSLLPVESDHNYEKLPIEVELEELAKHAFIAELFARDMPYRTIAHNAVFDLGRLGQRFDFTLSRNVKVWDTMVMAGRFMMAETNDQAFINIYELSLAAQLEMYGHNTLFFEDTDDEFYSLMKSNYRKNFDKLSADLWIALYHKFEKNHSSPLLPYIAFEDTQRGVAEDALVAIVARTKKIFNAQKSDEESALVEEEVAIVAILHKKYLEHPIIQECVQAIIAHYVAMDTIYTYDLYKFQIDKIKLLETQDVVIKHKSHKFSPIREIPRWVGVKKLVAWEQRISREAVNQCIRGVNIDRDFVRKTQQEWIDSFPAIQQDIDAVIDPSDPHLEYEEKAMAIYWYTSILNLFEYDQLNKSEKEALKRKVVYSKPSTWVNWRYTPLDRQELITLIDWSAIETEDEDFSYWQEMWLDYFESLTPDLSRGGILKGEFSKNFQNTTAIPQLDFSAWVQQTCFEKHPDAQHLTKFKVDWLSHKFTRTKSSNFTAEQLVNKKAFQKYYLFVKSGISIPDHYTIKYGDSLVTESHTKKVKEMKSLLHTIIAIQKGDEDNRDLTEGEKYLLSQPWWLHTESQTGELTFDEALGLSKVLRGIEPDYHQIALDNNWLSVKNKGILFYLPSEEDDNDEPNPAHFDHPARTLLDALQLLTLIADGDKYLLHSERDGKMHSTMSRAARTGRFTSSNPNMQNDRRKAVKGWIIPERAGYTIVGVDLANAENVSGAMLSGCSDFAMATESGDYHENQAKVYFSIAFSTAFAKQAFDIISELRGRGKPITFGIAYGMGNESLVVATGLSSEEVKAIRQALIEAYPVLYKVKAERARQVEQMKSYPAYTTLWTGSRVIVPFGYGFYKGKRTLKIQGYKRHNYDQQGAVGEIIARSMVLVSDWLDDNNKESRVLFNVHDELVLSLKDDEVDVVMPKVCEIMGDIVPIEYRQRTNPEVHFIADLGPENSLKWGYQDGVEYGLSVDHFWTRWGKMPLPDEELAKPIYRRKTPTWRGPVHEGWTLEKEMSERSQSDLREYADHYQEDAIHAEISETEAWESLKKIYLELYAKRSKLNIELSGTFTKPKNITLPYGESTKTFNNLLFQEWMTIARSAYHRGHNSLYRNAVKAILKIIEYCLLDKELEIAIVEWTDLHGHLLDEVIVHD